MGTLHGKSKYKISIWQKVNWTKTKEEINGNCKCLLVNHFVLLLMDKLFVIRLGKQEIYVVVTYLYIFLIKVG